jgi:preprotein translocase subunit SecA
VALTDFHRNPQVGKASEGEESAAVEAAVEAAEAAPAPRQVVIEVNTNFSRIKRNDPCPCGSGERFKKCHMGREDELAALIGGAAASPPPADEAPPEATA